MKRHRMTGHGRVEHRSYFLSTDLSGLCGVEKWCGLKAIGMVQSERYREGRVSIERRHYITSVDDIDSFRHAQHVGTGESRMGCIGGWTSRSGKTRVGFVEAMGPIIWV